MHMATDAMPIANGQHAPSHRRTIHQIEIRRGHTPLTRRQLNFGCGGAIYNIFLYIFDAYDAH